MTYTGLALVDPTLLASVRDQLAATFGHKIAAATPEVSEFIEFEAEAVKSAAEKANFEQAARVLHAARFKIASAVADAFTRRFDEKLDPEKRSLSRTTKLKLDQLSLVQDAEVEIDIAVGQCGSRLKEQCEYELFALTRRMAQLLGTRHLDDDGNPVHPRVFARTLATVLGELDAKPSTKLAMFKAFGPLLLDIVPDTITAGNTWLEARGIALEVEAPYGQPVITPERPFLPGPGASSHLVQVGDLVAALTTELSAANQTAAGIPSSPRQGGANVAAPVNVQSAQRVDTGAAAIWNERAVNDIPESAGPEDDALTADIVSAMFHHILADNRLPVILRGIVGRLLEPALDVGRVDASLFSNAHHPMRRLIDLIAEFGMTLSLDATNTSTIDSVARVVEDAVSRYRGDPQAFAIAYRRLDDMFYHHEESALHADPEILALQAAEARECAERAATTAIQRRLASQTLPFTVRSFIQIVWRDVLIRDFLAGGETGKSWKLGLATLDEILKSIQPATTRANQEALARSLPSLIELIRDGMESAGTGHLQIDSFLAEMTRLHEAALAANVIGAGTENTRPPQPALAADEILFPSPSARLNEIGVACGSWLEIEDAHGFRLWRLCWVTPHQGTCILKHFERHTMRALSLEQLAEDIRNGVATVLPNIGLTSAAIRVAFRVAAHNARAAVPAIADEHAAHVYERPAPGTQAGMRSGKPA
jgi:hypothetical protein